MNGPFEQQKYLHSSSNGVSLRIKLTSIESNQFSTANPSKGAMLQISKYEHFLQKNFFSTIFKVFVLLFGPIWTCSDIRKPSKRLDELGKFRFIMFLRSILHVLARFFANSDKYFFGYLQPGTITPGIANLGDGYHWKIYYAFQNKKQIFRNCKAAKNVSGLLSENVFVRRTVWGAGPPSSSARPENFPTQPLQKYCPRQWKLKSIFFTFELDSTGPRCIKIDQIQKCPCFGVLEGTETGTPMEGKCRHPLLPIKPK